MNGGERARILGLEWGGGLGKIHSNNLTQIQNQISKNQHVSFACRQALHDEVPEQKSNSIQQLT